MNRNREGYHDPTASEAVRRVSKELAGQEKRRVRCVAKCDALTYRLADLRSFQIAIAVMKR